MKKVKQLFNNGFAARKKEKLFLTIHYYILFFKPHFKLTTLFALSSARLTFIKN